MVRAGSVEHFFLRLELPLEMNKGKAQLATTSVDGYTSSQHTSDRNKLTFSRVWNARVWVAGNNINTDAKEALEEARKLHSNLTIPTSPYVYN